MAQRTRPYPRRSLEAAIAIPLAIKENNGGNPWPPAEVAKAVGKSPKASGFFYLTASARDYGLTEGARDAALIGLKELGREVVYPASSAEEADAMLRAFLNVKIFESVLTHFGGDNLPELQFLSNTLEQTFQLEAAWHDEFVKVFRENCRFLGIGADFRGSGRESDGDGSATRTLVEREGAPVCFVVMPFTEWEDQHEPGFFEEALRSLFEPALEKAGFEVRTAKRSGSDVIQATIIQELHTADLVLADLTEHNPNVLFELGVRMAEEKPVVLVKSRGTGRIFDVDNMLRVVEYSPNLWGSTVEKDLPILVEHITGAWEGREAEPTLLSILRRPGVSAT